MKNEFQHLLSPFKIGNTTIKNRLTVAPMGDGYLSLLGPRGEFSWQGMEHCIQRARGGFGMMVSGCILFPDNAVEEVDPISSLLDNKDIFIKQGLKLNERCSYYDMKMFQQLTLGLGRNWGMMSCSENPWFDDPSQMTEVLTVDQIKRKIECVVESAKVMQDAGFAGVEVHALHWGYLLDSFAMAITNHRTDEYGGSLENRLRACKEIVEGIKQVCGKDYPVMMRLGLKSYIKGLNQPSLTGEGEVGRTLEEGLRISQLLESYGYDALNVDAGTYDSFYYGCPPIYMPQGHCIPLAEECKKVVNIPVICGSRMNDPRMCEQGIADGKFDAVAIGRPSLADPNFAKKIETGKPETIRPCIGCLVGCMGKSRSGEVMTCAVNPTAYLEEPLSVQRTLEPKKVAVIGAGIAGMEAARTAKLRGFDVTVYEKTAQAGGNLPFTAKQYHKGELMDLVNWYVRELDRLNVPVHYETEATVEKLDAAHTDIVVLATGGKENHPSLPGAESKNCVSVLDFLKQDMEAGSNVVIIGGGLTGCETAVDLASKGKQVTLAESGDDILVNSEMVPIMVEQMLRDLLEYHHVTVMTGAAVESVGQNTVTINGNCLPADTVLFATGTEKKALPLEQELRDAHMEVFTVGDYANPSNIYSAVHSAYEIARNL